MAEMGARPDWVEDPPAINFQAMNPPLVHIAEGMVEVLDRLIRQETERRELRALLRVLLQASLQTHRAAVALVVHRPSYPAQTLMLSRSVFESLFTVCALATSPDRYVLHYQRAGYYRIWEQLRIDEQRHAAVPHATAWASEGRRLLADFGASLGLSAAEMAAPDAWPKSHQRWPTPKRLLDQVPFTSDDKRFLSDLYEGRYAELSTTSHLHWTGLAAASLAGAPGQQWIPGKFDSDAVAASLFFFLMLVCEIDRIEAPRYGYGPELERIWAVLLPHSAEAQRYYDMRYRAQLAASRV